MGETAVQLNQIRDYYMRPDVLNSIVKSCENREAVAVYKDGKFGSRPAAIFYPKDFELLLNQGAVVFLGSIERWANPFSIKTGMKRYEMDSLRTGWDMVIDIDSKGELSYAKKAALKLLEILERYGINSYTVKFSGRRGFHITLPFEIFPEKFEGKPTKQLFPELPRMIMDYLSYLTKTELGRELNINLDNFLTLDRGVLSQRHLIRAPYSLHLETGLASVYLSKDQLANFEPEHAKPENVKVFEPQIKPVAGEADYLIETAKIWSSNKPKPTLSLQMGSPRKFRGRGINPRYFPPCIRNILTGLSDGRKRSIFLLTTFLTNVGWRKEDIWRWLVKWNEKNNPPLPVSDLERTFKSQFLREKQSMAPNCDNLAYYKEFGVCTPDNFCPLIKNPVTYTLKKSKIDGEQIQRRSFRNRQMICFNFKHKVRYTWGIKKRYGLPAHCPSCGSADYIRLQKTESEKRVATMLKEKQTAA